MLRQHPCLLLRLGLVQLRAPCLLLLPPLLLPLQAGPP
jgi:hypothetical protein